MLSERSMEHRREYMRKRRAEHPEKIRDANTKWCQSNPDQVKRQRRAALQRELNRLEELAGRPKPKSCELCGCSTRQIHFDHCHSTDEFRGWLCVNCNMCLGLVADNPAILRRLAEYLESF